MPIVRQIEAWGGRHNVELAKPGWKVELAKRVKQRLLAEGTQPLSPDVLDRWVKLFDAFQAARNATPAASKVPKESSTTKTKSKKVGLGGPGGAESPA